MALLAANQLSRWCRDVGLEVPDVALVPALRRCGIGGLRERMLAEMRGADPFGVFGSSTTPTKIASVCASVPVPDVGTSTRTAGAAWLADSPPRPGCRRDRHPGRCDRRRLFGVALLFRDACGLPLPTEPWAFDTFAMHPGLAAPTGPARLARMNIGRVLLGRGGRSGVRPRLPRSHFALERRLDPRGPRRGESP